MPSNYLAAMTTADVRHLADKQSNYLANLEQDVRNLERWDAANASHILTAREYLADARRDLMALALELRARGCGVAEYLGAPA